MKTSKYLRISLLFVIFLVYLSNNSSGQTFVVDSFSITPAAVNVTNSQADIKFSLHAKDLVGYDSIKVKISNNLSTSLSLMSGSINDGLFEGYITIPQKAKGGIWYVEWIYLLTKQGLHILYNTNDLRSKGFPTEINVESILSDSQPPSLEDFTVTPQTIDVSQGPADIKFTFHVTDQSDAYNSLYLFLYSPLTGIKKYIFSGSSGDIKLVSGSAKDGYYEGTLTMPRYAEAGDWIISIYADDGAGNHTYYNTPELQSKGFPSKLKVLSSPSDMKAPLLQSLSITPVVVDINKCPMDVKFTLHVTDDITGTNDVYIRALPPSDIYVPDFHPKLISGTSTDGIYEGSLTIPGNNSALGEWNIPWVLLFDKFGHFEYTNLQNSGFPSKIIVANKTSAPVLMSPANESTNQPLTLTLKWDKTLFADTYHLQVSRDSLFSNLMLDDSTLTDITKVISGLPYSGTYYWRVKAANVLGSSDYSPVYAFTTIPPALAPPDLALPVNDAFDQSTTLELKWNPVPDASAYHLQVSTDSLFSFIVFNDSVLTASSKTITGLLIRTKYYWRVKAKAAIGTTPFSEIQSFTTIIEPGLISPINNSVNQPTRIILRWNPLSNAESYDIQISMDSLFANPLPPGNVQAGTSLQISGLLPNMKYYWRVRAKYKSGIGVFSKIWSFTSISVAPQRPVLLSPADNSTNEKSFFCMSWSSALFAESYELQLSEDSLFISPFPKSTLTDTLLNVSGIPPNTRIYWRVRAINPVGSSDYSEKRSYITFRTAPAAPLPLSPADGSAIQTPSVSLSWSVVNLVNYYWLQVSTDKDFNNLLVNDSTITASSRQITGLTIGTRYYWRVSAKNEFGKSPFSAAKNFTPISAELPSPVLTAPANGTLNQPITVTLRWDPVFGAENYYLQISEDEHFTSITAYAPNISRTAVDIPLANKTKYYWRVKAKNENGESPYSSVFHFTTIVAAPESPVLISPEVNASNQSLDCTLRWNSVDGAANYKLQVSTDQNFDSLIVNDSALTTTSRQLTGLSNNTRYYWRVNAKNIVGTSPFSSTWYFTTIIAAPEAPKLLQPENNALNQPIELPLKWQKLKNAEKYQIQISLVQDYSSFVINDSTLSDTLKHVTSLKNNTSYFWRVRARNAGGVSPWSETWTFKTIVSSPSAPVLISPANGNMNQPIDLKLSWNPVITAGSYRILVSQDTLFSNPVIDDSSLTSASKDIVGLKNGIKYYWKVRAKNINGVSPWSDIWSFSTIIAKPEIPMLAYPENNSANMPVDLTLRWNKSSGTEKYLLQLSSDGTFGSIVLSDTSLADTLKKVNPLVYNSKYYWRVKAINIGGESPWSEVWSFRTIIAAPEAPGLLLPENNALNQPIDLPLKWRKLKDAEKYQLQISTLQDFRSLFLNDSTLSDTLKQVTSLQNKTTYYWRVRAINIGGMGSWSEARTFTTIVSIPSVPVLVSPSDRANQQAVSLKFSWNPSQDAETYSFLLCRDTLFTFNIADDSILVSPSKEISGLNHGMKYYWKVKAKNVAGVSLFSPVWSFTTLIPAPENLTAAASGVRKVKLNWTDVSDGEDGFIIERNIDKIPGYEIIDTVKANTTSFTDSTVSFGIAYNYRLKAYTQFASSAYSGDAQVTSLTSVESWKSEIPTEYALKQNFPNPFNPSTIIRYSLPYESRVKISIFNSLGQLVNELVDKVEASGNYEKSFNAENLPSGIYIYSISVRSTDGKNNFSSVKKMMLVK